VSPFRSHNMPLSFIQVFAAVIDGPNAPEHLLEDRPVHVQAQTMRSKLNVEYTTPGAIAGAAVLVRGRSSLIYIYTCS
jgi:hypothetical protein